MQTPYSGRPAAAISRIFAVVGLAVFGHVVAHPVFDPACLGHGLEMPAGSDHGGGHGMDHGEEEGDADAPLSHHEVCVCEFSGNVPPDLPLPSTAEAEPVRVPPVALESATLVHVPYRLPLPNGPPSIG